MVWPGAGASSGGAGLSVACPVQGPAQQLCTVGGLGKCWQKAAGTGPWAWGPRQVSRRRRMPSPQETEHWQEKGRGVGLTRPEDDKDGGGQRPGVICCDLCPTLEAGTCPHSPDEVTCVGHTGGRGRDSSSGLCHRRGLSLSKPESGDQEAWPPPPVLSVLQPSARPARPAPSSHRPSPDAPGPSDRGRWWHRLFSTPERASEGTQPYLPLSSWGLARYWARNGTCLSVRR